MKREGTNATAHLIKPLAFLAGCTEGHREALARWGRIHRFPRHAVLQAQGDPPAGVFFLLQGEVVMEKTVPEKPEAARLSMVRSGEMFGFGECLLRTCYASARAVTPVLVWLVNAREFMDHFLAVPLLRERLFRTFSDITRILIHRAVAGDARHELAFFLRHACRENGRRVGNRIRIESLVKQPAVASVLNLSREHVTRLFADLRREGVVDFNRGHPLVDPAWLDRMTEDCDLADSLQYRDLPDSASGQ